MTSSSLEVLAGLGFSNAEYLDHMVFKDSKPSPFYESYVRDIQTKITENAAAEFACIWRAHAAAQSSKTQSGHHHHASSSGSGSGSGAGAAASASRTLLSDTLSTTLNALQAELEASDLFDDRPSREGVLRRAIPATLVKQVGLPALMSRLPEPYQRALFSSWVASHFVRCFFFLFFSFLSFFPPFAL